jgi:hypothetical protein
MPRFSHGDLENLMTGPRVLLLTDLLKGNVPARFIMVPRLSHAIPDGSVI